MGSSTVTIESIVDYVSTMGELAPVLPVGGFSIKLATGIATDVIRDLLAQRFPFKWNRFKAPSFYTNSWQQDYAQVGLKKVDWLESATWVDINNTSLPKPSLPVEAVQDLQPTSISGNPPSQVCWKYNSELNQGVWPGAGKVYTNPVGANQLPTNGPTNILDAHGNILVLTQYGTTGAVAPDAGANAAEGTVVVDNTCRWTVASPDSQGYRVSPLPPQQGVVYQVNPIAQAVAPAAFTQMGQVINPIPDNYAQNFITGFIVYLYRNSPNPKMQQLFDTKRGAWLAAQGTALKQGDKETSAAGFIPDRSVVSPQGSWDIGPANPYLYPAWPGR